MEKAIDRALEHALEELRTRDAAELQNACTRAGANAADYGMRAEMDLAPREIMHGLQRYWSAIARAAKGILADRCGSADLLERAVRMLGQFRYTEAAALPPNPPNLRARAVWNRLAVDDPRRRCVCYLVEVCGVSFRVWDNGEEVGVERLNSGELPRFAPMSREEVPLNAATLASRIATLLRGEELNFEFELTDEDQSAIEADVREGAAKEYARKSGGRFDPQHPHECIDCGQDGTEESGLYTCPDCGHTWRP